MDKGHIKAGGKHGKGAVKEPPKQPPMTDVKSSPDAGSAAKQTQHGRK